MAEPRLFDPGPKQRPDRNYDPNQWVKSPDVVWHASESATPPKPQPRPVPPEHSKMQGEEHYPAGAFHTGSLRAAVERAHLVGYEKNSAPREHLHPYALSGQFALPQGNYQSERHRGMGGVWNDDVANFQPESVAMLRRGKNVAYRNQVEASGSVSFVTARPENLTTWSESTLRDPEAPRHLKHLAEHYELTGKRSPQVVTGWTQQQSLPGIPSTGQQREPVMRGALPAGFVGHSEEESVKTTARPVIHTLRRKY